MCYSVLASILRETQEWEHEALIIGDHLSQPSSLQSIIAITVVLIQNR